MWMREVHLHTRIWFRIHCSLGLKIWVNSTPSRAHLSCSKHGSPPLEFSVIVQVGQYPDKMQKIDCSKDVIWWQLPSYLSYYGD